MSAVHPLRIVETDALARNLAEGVAIREGTVDLFLERLGEVLALARVISIPSNSYPPGIAQGARQLITAGEIVRNNVVELTGRAR